MERFLFIIFICFIKVSNVLAIINGQTLHGISDLVRLEFDDGDSVCSGFFIKKTLIVTSAHCLYSWKDGSKSKLTNIVTVGEKKLGIQALEYISHPKYEKGLATHDLAIIKVSKNELYEGNFQISSEKIPTWGTIVYFGAGKIDMENKIYGRAKGESKYLKLGAYIFGIGPSKNSVNKEGFSSIASNDSGSPVILKETGKVVAVASQSTAITISETFLPAISVSTSLEESSNYSFLANFINH
ncbi:MAG: trypsin-like serine protease [Bacteriovoracaceae bacterium]|nr:trypsin-like serine protease [Bacteriovoracaceae bacterium]